MTVWIQFLEYMVKCNKSQTYSASSQAFTLPDRCPNTEFFLVRFLRIRTECGPEKTPYMDTFHAV